MSEFTKENIWTACSEGDVARVAELLSEGQDVNAYDEFGYSPIHAAVSYCHLDLVQMLLAAGADPNLRDTDGDCPLHVCESSEVASLLLASGAVLQNRNSCGETVLDKALQEANQEMISFYESIGFTDHSFVPPDDNDGEDYERYDVDSAEVQDYLRSLQEGNSEEDAGPASGVP